MSRISGPVIAFVCAMVGTAGCKAVPDGDDFDRLTDKIAGIPIEARLALDRWAANRVAYGYLLNSRKKYKNIGHLFCGNTSTQTGEHIPVEIARMLQCLNAHQTSTYAYCLNKVLEDIQDENFDKGYQCEWVSFENGMDPATTPGEFNAERHSDETLAEILVGPYMPPIEIQMILAGLPGFVGPRGVICAQGVDWACADNPLDGDQSPTTSASSGGGDR